MSKSLMTTVAHGLEEAENEPDTQEIIIIVLATLSNRLEILLAKD